MQNSIKISALSLAKNNNGFFKSEKQAAFLISQFELTDGCIGHAESGYNSCPIFVNWDEKGITKIYKHAKTKKGYVNKTMFIRKVDGVLTELELKEIKRLERRLQQVQKSYNERIERFNNGTYNKTGVYDDATIRTFEWGKQQDATHIANLENAIAAIKNK